MTIIPYERTSYEGKTELGKLKIDCWHPEKNNGLSPRDVFKSTNKVKFWFKCDSQPLDSGSCLNSITRNKSTCLIAGQDFMFQFRLR